MNLKYMFSSEKAVQLFGIYCAVLIHDINSSTCLFTPGAKKTDFYADEGRNLLIFDPFHL